jgi:hypothetical protein
MTPSTTTTNEYQDTHLYDGSDNSKDSDRSSWDGYESESSFDEDAYIRNEEMYQEYCDEMLDFYSGFVTNRLLQSGDECPTFHDFNPLDYPYESTTTSQTATSQAETSQAETSQAATSQTETSQAETSQAATSQAATSQTATSQAVIHSSDDELEFCNWELNFLIDTVNTKIVKRQ